MNAVAYINLTTPEKAVYGIENYSWAIQNLVQTSLRSIVGEMDLDDALSSRDHIKARLKSSISDDISDWGITLKTVEIQDIKPSVTMQTAMEEQAAAERQRRATVTKAMVKNRPPFWKLMVVWKRHVVMQKRKSYWQNLHSVRLIW
jgi:Membrane protease subunits, stomatin/prohibitin homologs